MGQFRFVGREESDLKVGRPNPGTVSPGQVFTVDDEADEAYSTCPDLYEVIKSTWTPPPARAEEDVVVPGPLRREPESAAPVVPPVPAPLATPPPPPPSASSSPEPTPES